MSVEEFIVEREDDGEQFVLMEVTTYHEAVVGRGGRTAMVPDAAKDIASPDGRDVFMTSEGKFYFADETDRPLRRIEPPRRD